ncbi:hypothetical protein MAM1_0337c09811 [Mucor ambiguus]|uniref:Uncharacterized protein n=1 Tax=Mucor ambiguus TaxID=91626 RepID=A0A0C9N6T0_9FUNG|nr:hypothetical protein MAM1_0337c09811 [Mucor ambiguus]
MPSRNAASSNPKKLKYKVDKVVITPEKRVPKKKLEVLVNETSSPEAILHASWEFISAFQFFNTFKTYFHLPKSLSIDKLEQAMLAGKDDMQQQDDEPVEDELAVRMKRESSTLSQQSNASSTATPQPVRHYLANFMVHIVSPLLTQRQRTLINTDNYEQFIADVFPDFTNFVEMSVLDKIKVIKSIEMAHVEIGDPELISLQNGQSGQELRFAPLGNDYEGWVYWYFGDERLYREIPLPIGRKTVTISDTLEFTFELVCSTAQEWRDVIDKFKPTKRTSNRDLASTITALGKEMIAKLEAREEYRLKNEAKIKRARELELIPKKRSRRLEVKFDEQAKRQKLLDEAKEQADLEEKERQKKAKEEKLAVDRDRKELQTEEAKLRKDLFGVINDFVSQDQETEADMKPLKALINSKTPQDERIQKMKGWIKLLRGTVSVELVGEPQQIQFVGQGVDTALESVLFKNTMRIYLATLLLLKLNPITLAYENTEEVHKKLVLSRYDGIDAFCQELNTAIESISEAAVREDAIRMLMTIFTPVSAEESQQADIINQDQIAGSSVPDAVLELDAATTTTTATPEDTIESTTALKIAEPTILPTSGSISAEIPAAKNDSFKSQSASLNVLETNMPSSIASVPELASSHQI